MEKIDVFKKIFIPCKDDSGFEFNNSKYSDVEYLDILDTICLFETNGQFDLFESCPEFLDIVLDDFMSAPPSKRVPFIMFLPIENLTSLIIKEKDKRLLDMFQYRYDLNKEGKSFYDLAEN